MRTRVVLVVALVVATTGCGGSHPSVTKPDTVTTTTEQPRTVACDTAGAAAVVRHLPSSAGSVWVWIEAASRTSFRVGSLVKIVWRITGRGRPRVLLSTPAGRAAGLTFGPEQHGQSTFRHPGAEYGTGFVPTAPGCWRMTMRRGEVGGSVFFPVTA
jgi:hypothetical protein